MNQSYSYESPSMRNNVNGFSNGHSTHSPIINYRKDAKKGVKFTFMVVGESGTGKTTFINSLLNKKVLNHRYEHLTHNNNNDNTKILTFTSAKSVALPNTSMLTRQEFNPRTINEEPGIALTETNIEIVDDDNMKILLNIIDTPGFGENLNNELCFIEIENYLKQQFDLVLAEETRIKRNPRFIDTRVHVMLYFITPTGHGLREIDIQCMKRLSKYVNIIPVISKADSFTSSELSQFKQQIRYDIEKFNVPIFQFDNFLNEYDEDEDRDLIEECQFLASLQPFAIVTSEDTYEIRDVNGEVKTIKARKYPWGLIDINDRKVSDFAILKNVLLGTHLQDLKDLTHDFLYETYRTERLTKVTGNGSLEDEDYEDSEFHDTVEHHNEGIKDIPSLSNLAQLTDSTTSNNLDVNSMSSNSSLRKSTSMLIDAPSSSSSPKLKNAASFTSSTSTISFENGGSGGGGATERAPNNNAFKRLSIGPQRNQLRQISETVPYVLRHERILERQQKLEEMESASAKELANRAALLEKKAAELKAKERTLMKQLEMAKQRELSRTSSNNINANSTTNYEDDEKNIEEIRDDSSNYENSGSIQKDETLTDLHSIVSNQPEHQHIPKQQPR
ncbi:unnamed protein product [Candida verbasci]|uniref:Septin-type G domain-containing protein n=1 Tax=Candida verbasci TaxID=1227364 RepID=A0A9W4XM68_9ASCO|nr:unnamed protein product [Candida verbasci]